MDGPTILTRYDQTAAQWVAVVTPGGRAVPRERRFATFHELLLALGDEWGQLQPEPLDLGRGW